VNFVKVYIFNSHRKDIKYLTEIRGKKNFSKTDSYKFQNPRAEHISGLAYAGMMLTPDRRESLFSLACLRTRRISHAHEYIHTHTHTRARARARARTRTHARIHA